MDSLSALLSLFAIIVGVAAVPVFIVVGAKEFTERERRVIAPLNQWPPLSKRQSFWVAGASLGLYGLALIGGLVLQHNYPQGVLLYTPPANYPAEHTPSFPLAFAVVLAASAILSAALALGAHAVRKYSRSSSVVSLRASTVCKMSFLLSMACVVGVIAEEVVSSVIYP